MNITSLTHLAVSKTRDDACPSKHHSRLYSVFSSSVNDQSCSGSLRYLSISSCKGMNSHTLAVMSHDAVTIYFPSGLNWADLTSYSCLNGSVTGSPVLASHTLAVLPHDAVTIYFPSGLNWAEKTESSCFNGSVTGSPVLASHTLAVLSSDAVTIYFPSGLNWAE